MCKYYACWLVEFDRKDRGRAGVRKKEETKAKNDVTDPLFTGSCKRTIPFFAVRLRGEILVDTIYKYHV